jgi:hypothetical protein
LLLEQDSCYTSHLDNDDEDNKIIIIIIIIVASIIAIYISSNLIKKIKSEVVMYTSDNNCICSKRRFSKATTSMRVFVLYVPKDQTEILILSLQIGGYRNELR